MVPEVVVAVLGLVGWWARFPRWKWPFPPRHVSLWCHGHASGQVDSLHLPRSFYTLLPPSRLLRGTAMLVGLAGFALSHSAPYLVLHVGPVPPELYFGLLREPVCECPILAPGVWQSGRLPSPLRVVFAWRPQTWSANHPTRSAVSPNVDSTAVTRRIPVSVVCRLSCLARYTSAITPGEFS